MNNKNTKNLYEILGVNKNATSEEISKSYRKLAVKYHPDRAAPDNREEATKKFQEINHAYDILSKPESRNLYDATGQTDGNARSDGFGFGGGSWEFDMSGSSGFGGFGGFSGFGGFGNIEDILANAFGRQQVQQQKFVIRITIIESFMGVTKNVSVRPHFTCTKCSSNKSFFTQCNKCGGARVIKEEKQYSIVIPGGTCDGDIQRIRDSNDIFVFKIDSQDKKYEIHNKHDLITNMTIDRNQIKLDRTLHLTDLDGSSFTYRVGSEHNVFTATIKIPGRGLWTNTQKTRRGDLIVRLSLLDNLNN